MKKKIFNVLFRLALNCWRFAIWFAKTNNMKPVGIPHQRDPDAPCEFYEPTRRTPNLWQDCETDGHYLCNKCFHNLKNKGL